MMNKYIIYARVNVDRFGASIKYQIDQMQSYAKHHNLNVDLVITEVGSGISVKRAGIYKLVRQLSTGDYKGVLCIRLDRLNREFTVMYKLWTLIVEKDIEIVTPFHTYRNDSQSKLLLDFQTKLPELERLQHSERIKRGFRKKKLEVKSCEK